MPRTLRLPETLAFVVLAAACGGDSPRPDATPAADAALVDSGPQPCVLFCIPEDSRIDASVLADAAVCPSCADEQGLCPVGCRPVG